MGSFDSLRYRNYRLMWTGAILSNVGTWMQSIALAWFVFELTHSAFWVSFVTFINFLPTVLSPIGGVYTDRLDRRKILLVTQTVMMLDAAALAVLAATGHATLFLVMTLTFGVGLAFAFNGPAWLSFVPSLVPPEALVNAIALNSAQFSLARVIGPAIAGVLIPITGPGLIFGVNAVSFVAVLVALALIRNRPMPPRPPRKVHDLLVGGIVYTWRHRRIRTMIAAVAVVSLFAAPVTSLLPIYAADVFGRGAGAFGFLAAAMGVGSVAGALAVGRLGSRVSPRKVAGAMVALSAVLVLFASTRSFPLGVALMAAYGGVYLFAVAATNGDIQLQVEEAVRGRVLSIFMLAFGALFPAGSLLAGIIAQHFGAPVTTVAGGIACALWGLGLLWRERGPAVEPVPEMG